MKTARQLAVILLSLLVFVSGCTMRPEGLPIDSQSKKPSSDLGAGVFGRPIVLDGWDYVFVPFALVRPESNKMFQGVGSLSLFSSYSGSGIGSVSLSGPFHHTSNAHWNNLLIFDKRTGASRLLLDTRAVIVEASFPAAKLDRTGGKVISPPPGYVLLAIARADTNGDRVINEEDASVLHHLDVATGALTPVTPEGTQFDHFEADDAGGAIYVRYLVNADTDRAFAQTDKAVVTRVDLAKPGVSQPIVSDELARQAYDMITRPGAGGGGGSDAGR